MASSAKGASVAIKTASAGSKESEKEMATNMKNELTQQEQADVRFYEDVHTSNMQKVNGIWKPIRDEKEVVSKLSTEDQKRYRRGKLFDNLGNWSINGVPVTADNIRKQLRENERI